jgi:hypothetical protein
VSRVKLQQGDPWMGLKVKAHRGVWTGAGLDGRRTAIVSCPTCGMSASRSGHTIYSNGDVAPSLVCPRSSCAFHEHVTLVGWKP